MMRFFPGEVFDLAKAWVALSVAFVLAFGGGVEMFGISALTVGAGFLLHELAHKFTAMSFGRLSMFRADNYMLGLMLVFSLFGFIFAAPGAVMIRGSLPREKSALVAASGPLTNLVLAGLFFLLPWQSASVFGTRINLWLALFNLIPLGILDGAKVWQGNKLLWLTLAAVAVAGFVFL